jgi:hypothetical protein
MLYQSQMSSIDLILQTPNEVVPFNKRETR